MVNAVVLFLIQSDFWPRSFYFWIRNWSHIATPLVVVVLAAVTLFKKAQGPVVSNQIGMKFGRIVFPVNTHRLTKSSLINIGIKTSITQRIVLDTFLFSMVCKAGVCIRLGYNYMALLGHCHVGLACSRSPHKRRNSANDQYYDKIITVSVKYF